MKNFTFNWILLYSFSESCGFPGAPAHSTVEFSSSNVGPGTVARYTCDRGFELLGPARRICNTNGTWVPQGIPFCGKLNNLFVTSKKRNHKSTNPVFTNLNCCKMYFLVEIKYYYNGVFCIFWLKSKVLPLARLSKKHNKNRWKQDLSIRSFIFLMSRTGKKI